MKLFAALLLLILLVPQLLAERYACILALRAGTPELTEENKRFCQELYKLLKEKGFQEKNIKWLSSLPQKGLSETAALTNVRTTFDRMEKELNAEDELYIFSVGYLSANSRRVALATTGGRMLGRELAERLDAIKAKQFLFLFNTQGSALFEKLAHGMRLVVSATDDAAQLNPPATPAFSLRNGGRTVPPQTGSIFFNGPAKRLKPSILSRKSPARKTPSSSTTANGLVIRSEMRRPGC